MLEEWTAAVCAELGIDPATVDAAAVLDLARDVAHGVARPAAPLTAYLVGVAVGQGRAQQEATQRVLSRLKTELPESYKDCRPRREAVAAGVRWGARDPRAKGRS